MHIYNIIILFSYILNLKSDSKTRQKKYSVQVDFECLVNISGNRQPAKGNLFCKVGRADLQVWRKKRLTSVWLCLFCIFLLLDLYLTRYLENYLEAFDEMPASDIQYSEKYFCKDIEHRHVILPVDLAVKVPRTHLMTETEWRNLGIQQSPGWIHFMIHDPEPHVILFRKAEEYYKTNIQR